MADRLIETIIGELPFFGPEDAVCLGGVNWDQYRRAVKAQEELGRRLQISYASGRLEVLPNAFRTEVRRCLLRSFVCLSAEIFGQEMYVLGSTTLAGRDRDYGFDPQESFCFRNLSRGVLDPQTGPGCGPPPDLVIEVENPKRASNRLPMCVRAGVPEVWFDDLDTLRILSLQPDQTYSVTDYSPAFPLIPSHDLNRFLSLAHTNEMTAVSREFRAYVESLMPTLAAPDGTI
ncbi:MAG: Uma2 family endonuclease [Zavarzinella sp.]|nr:Uma2 family endonuclease [Zavarzinella sp.]